MTQFTIPDSADSAIDRWHKNHDCKLRTDAYGVDGEIYVGAIGGSTTYTFTPTGIGTVIKARCACGAEIDVTDYDSW